jgi:hypothetical protein
MTSSANLIYCAAMLFLVTTGAAAAGDPGIVGDVRVQFLSSTLVRLEQRGPRGFEDRKTFTVVKRPRAASGVERAQSGSSTILTFRNLEVEIPNPKSLKGITVRRGHELLYTCDGEIPPTSFFPAPASKTPSIAIADNPRIVPPKWGASAAPRGSRTHKDNSGWDLSNHSLDIYVFLLSN